MHNCISCLNVGNFKRVETLLYMDETRSLKGAMEWYRPRKQGTFVSKTWIVYHLF